MAVLQVITGPQDGLLKSSRTSIERCNQFLTITQTVPRFLELSGQVSALIAQIDAAIVAKQSSRFTANVTNEKNSRIATFIEALNTTATIVIDLAIENKNKIWEDTAKRAVKNKTKSMSEEGLMAMGTEFINMLRTIDVASLNHFGIDDDEIVALEDQIKDVNAWRLRKEVTVDQKALDNELLASLFQSLKSEKEKMDRLSERFVNKSPEFYAAYQKASAIDLKTGSKTTRAKKDPTLLPKTKTKKSKGNSATNGNNPTEASSNTVLTTTQHA